MPCHQEESSKEKPFGECSDAPRVKPHRLPAGGFAPKIYKESMESLILAQNER